MWVLRKKTYLIWTHTRICFSKSNCNYKKITTPLSHENSLFLIITKGFLKEGPSCYILYYWEDLTAEKKNQYFENHKTSKVTPSSFTFWKQLKLISRLTKFEVISIPYWGASYLMSLALVRTKSTGCLLANASTNYRRHLVGNHTVTHASVV